jgi:hypothetical protein
MQMKMLKRGIALAAPLALAGMLGCQGDSTGAPAGPDPAAGGVGLSFSVPQGVAFNRLAEAAGGHSLELSQVQMVVSRIRLRLADQTEPGCAGPNEQHPCIDFKAGPVLVELPVHGGLVTPIASDLPPGSYRFILINVFPPAGDDATATAFRAANAWPATASMRVKGTYDGQAFDTYLPVNGEVYNPLNPPFTVTGDSNASFNITIGVDPHGWFKTPAGALIDPRSLATEPTLRDQVSGNVRASFHAFSDNQRHGS